MFITVGETQSVFGSLYLCVRIKVTKVRRAAFLNGKGDMSRQKLLITYFKTTGKKASIIITLNRIIYVYIYLWM